MTGNAGLSSGWFAGHTANRKTTGRTSYITKERQMRSRTGTISWPAWLTAATLMAALAAVFILTAGQTQADSHISTNSTRLWGNPQNGQFFSPGETIRVRFQLSAPAHVPEGVGISLEFTDGDGTVHKRFAAHNRDASTDERPVFEYDVANGDPKAAKIAITSGFRNGSVVGRNSDNTPNEDVIVHFYGDSNLQTWEQENGEVTDPASYGVDGRPKVEALGITSEPSVSQVVRSHNYSWTFDDSYRMGEKVYVVMSFDQPVDVEGDVCISMRIGETDTWRGAWYEDGTGTVALVFTYTVQTGDYDDNGIGLDSGGGSDRDSRYGFCGGGKIVSAGTDTETSYSYNGFRNKEGQNVDGRPYITSGKITSSPVSGDTYWTGEKVLFTLGYTAPVDVSGKPTIDAYLDYDARPFGAQANRKATYESGSGTGQLVFAYQVQEDDRDLDGVALNVGLGEDADYGLKDGKVYAAGTTTEANNLFSHIADDADHKIDGSLGDRTPPELTGLTVTSDPGSDRTYKAGDTIMATAQFSEDVTVEPDEGAKIEHSDEPGVFLTVGIGDTPVAFDARGDLGSSDQIVFEYNVREGESDEDGISFKMNPLTALGFTIRDEDGNDAVLTYGAVSGNSQHKVDAVAPTFGSLSITSRPDGGGDTYENGDTIRIGGSFDEDITVTGSPQLTINVGGSDRTAEYQTSEGNLILFRYTVQDGDSDTDGVSVDAGTINLNGGSITDAAGNPASLVYASVDDQSGHRVDARPPTVSTVAMHSIPDAGNTYRLGEKIEVKVTFSEYVTVTGSPQLKIDLDGADRTAVYQETDGSQVIFAYTVQDGDESAYGVAIKANSLELNGGSIRDAVGNDARLAHPGTLADSAQQVDDSDKTSPSITGIAFTSTPASGNTYGTGEVIEITVTFDEDITVTGTPQLELFFDGDNGIADYSSASGADMVFNYTVKVGDSASDGLAVFANKLTLNGGTIKDAADNAASLSHAGHGPIQQYVNGAGGV